MAEAPEDVPPGLQAQLAGAPPGFQESLKLDAPLSVQAQSRAGSFPFNKFSSVPLGIAAARQAFGESRGNDAFKRLMIVPNCHVKRLRTRTYTLATGVTVQEVDGIDTGNGFIDLTGPIAGNANRRPVVVLALGAIESARLALLSASGLPNVGQIGANFMVHLRTNSAFTTKLPAGLGLTDQELCALLVRCRANLAGTQVHFHLQITASALPAGSGPGTSDALLFQNVPDLDNLRLLSEIAPGEVNVSIRAVGEMLPNLQNNAVTVPLQAADNDEFIVPRASVSVVRSPTDVQVMNLMNAATIAAAQQIFGKAIAGSRGRRHWQSGHRPAHPALPQDRHAGRATATRHGIEALRRADAGQLAPGRARHVPCHRWRPAIRAQLRPGASLVYDSHAQELPARA